MVAAIADASVLIHLAGIGHLTLLPSFYETVLVPEAVWDEVVESGGSRPGAQEVRAARKDGWIEVTSPQNVDLLRLLEQSLGRGESEAIAIAVEHTDPILLVDEREARAKAAIYDLDRTGVVGLLIRASTDGRIEDLEATLQHLREETGFWIDDDLVELALERAGHRDGKA